MSLDFNWEAVADKTVLEGEEKVITEAIIWATITVGISRITAENAEKFALRLNAITQARGALVNKYDADGMKPYRITLTDVRKRIGLFTNASPLTDTKFKAALIAGVMRDAAETLGTDRRKLETETLAKVEAVRAEAAEVAETRIDGNGIRVYTPEGLLKGFQRGIG